MARVEDVAAYFLAIQDLDAGEQISNLKLQKLCYYAQGFHLAIHGVPLFDERIYAWEHGPVVESLYHRYKEFGSMGIPVTDDVPTDGLTPEERGVIEEVSAVYGQFSGWKLRNMTHDEPPWIEGSKRGNRVISNAAMAEYFQTLLETE